jgi:hypothetical protein
MGAAFNYDGGLKASTLLSVLKRTGGNDPGDASMHLVAALLSAAANLYEPVNGLTVPEIQDMYKQMLGGHFEPTPGVSWTPAELVSFLQQTMTA